MENLDEFRHMWDGTQPGWRLIRYDSPVYLVAFHFDDAGPNPQEFACLVKWVECWPSETEKQAWERLRDCTEIDRAAPFGPSEIESLRQQAADIALKLTVHKIDQGDYLVLSPTATHQQWLSRLGARRPVVMKMLAAGVEVLDGHLD